MKRIIIYVVLFHLLVTCLYAKGQKEEVYEYYYVEDIIINTGIGYYGNNTQAEILLRTKEGCPNTEFTIKKGFYDTFQKTDGIIVASNMDDLNNYKENYFDLKYLDTFNEEYFEQNNLIFILQSYGSGVSYRNERIEILNEYYVLVNELWRADFPWVKACRDIDIFIIKIPKQIT
jgi:hypothetical protein